MTRIAHCCCGSLHAEVSGELALVAACHCMECQRRTGSPFVVSTYFPKDQVRTDGPSTVYVRSSDSGRKPECHFCPSCGSTVFWYAERFPDLIGIAVGAFADPSMPRPTLSVWETTRHPWVSLNHQLDHFGHQPRAAQALSRAAGELPIAPHHQVWSTTVTTPEVIVAKRSDESRITSLMTLAFANDPAGRRLYPDQLQYLTHFPEFVRLYGGKAFEHNCAHVTVEGGGAALWLPPTSIRTTTP